MNPGWKTSEFWIALIAQVLSLLTVLGFINAEGARTLEAALGQCVAAVFLFLTNAWVVVQYIRGRVVLKEGAGNGGVRGEGAAAEGSGVRGQGSEKSLTSIGLLVLAGWLLGPAMVEAGTPAVWRWGWRGQVEQRLNEHQRLLDGLLQGKQTPIIVLPPFPIQGEPKQPLPIQGDPRQILPIPGDPRQLLPIPGDPRQLLPIPGQPQPGLPQSYTVFALGRPSF